MRTLLVCLAASSLCVGAETYKFSLAQTSEVGGKLLTPGDYRLEIDGAKACFRHGKTAVEVAVQSESTAAAKSTLIQYDTTGGMYHIREITPKGSTVRLTFAK